MKKISRRTFIRLSSAAMAGGAFAACAAPAVEQVEKEVTRVVKEVVKETVIVPEVVKETVEVEKVVKETVVVEKEVVVEMPARFVEAPLLQTRVAAGELPPVDDRLPPVPLMLQPLDQVGV